MVRPSVFFQSCACAGMLAATSLPAWAALSISGNLTQSEADALIDVGAEQVFIASASLGDTSTTNAELALELEEFAPDPLGSATSTPAVYPVGTTAEFEIEYAFDGILTFTIEIDGPGDEPDPPPFVLALPAPGTYSQIVIRAEGAAITGETNGTGEAEVRTIQASPDGGSVSFLIGTAALSTTTPSFAVISGAQLADPFSISGDFEFTTTPGSTPDGLPRIDIIGYGIPAPAPGSLALALCAGVLALHGTKASRNKQRASTGPKPRTVNPSIAQLANF